MHEIAYALHYRPVDVGGLVSLRVESFDAGGDEGEACAGGLEIIEEGVGVLRARDVDEGHGGFEDDGRYD